jgi:hypothetical protein
MCQDLRRMKAESDIAIGHSSSFATENLSNHAASSRIASGPCMLTQPCVRFVLLVKRVLPTLLCRA